MPASFPPTKKAGRSSCHWPRIVTTLTLTPLLDAAAVGHVEEPPADPFEAPVDARPRGRLLGAEAFRRLELDREADRRGDLDRLGVRLRGHVGNGCTTRSRRQDEDRPSEGRASEAR